MQEIVEPFIFPKNNLYECSVIDQVANAYSKAVCNRVISSVSSIVSVDDFFPDYESIQTNGLEVGMRSWRPEMGLALAYLRQGDALAAFGQLLAGIYDDLTPSIWALPFSSSHPDILYNSHVYSKCTEISGSDCGKIVINNDGEIFKGIEQNVVSATTSIKMRREQKPYILTCTGEVGKHQESIWPLYKVSCDHPDYSVFISTLEEAYSLIKAYAPNYYQWVIRAVKGLSVFVKDDGTGVFISSSSSVSPGIITVSMPIAALSLAETLVHEATHQYFLLLAYCFPFHDGSDNSLYYSPVRHEKRPLGMILFAFHAVTNMALFYKQIMKCREYNALATEFYREKKEAALILVKKGGCFNSSERAASNISIDRDGVCLKRYSLESTRSTVANLISQYQTMRLLLIILLIFLHGKALATIEIKAEYHQPTDLFVLMDGVSKWGFNDKAYHEYWKARFGWSRKDKAVSKLYRGYRDRNYFDKAQGDKNYRAEHDGIFAAKSSYLLNTDPLAEHFINSPSITSALSNLDKVTSKVDADNLRLFYENFRPKWEVLLEESNSFYSSVEGLHSELKGKLVEDYLSRLSEFYQMKLDLKLSARFVWWPPIGRTLADISGQTIFLRINPARHGEKKDWSEIVMHEAVHYVSAHQLDEQKYTLSKSFVKTCPIFKKKNFSHYLEEPLAVAWGQAAFAKYGRGKPLNLNESWYNNPITELMGRLLWLHVDEIYHSDKVLDDDFIQIAARNCALFLQAM